MGHGRSLMPMGGRPRAGDPPSDSFGGLTGGG
jgi:hypothetical protein